MSLESDIQLLSRVPIFSDLSPDHLRLLAFSAGHRELKKGDMLFQKGEAAHCGYVVASGILDLVETDNGKRSVKMSCDTTSVIGELSLFVENERTCNCVAATDATVLELSRILIVRMLTEYPAVAASIRARLTDRLDETLADLAPVHERLAKALAAASSDSG
jgi:CRP-like cAMP-binding protein